MEPHDRRDLFNEAAGRRGDISAGVIEKDFWVCWTLKHIFALGPAPAQLIFKGGTSLSKVYGVIERFSEDIDLSISREDLGFVGDRDPYKAASGKKKQALITEIQTRCREVIEAELLPKLHVRFESILGPGATGTPWSLSPDENDPQKIYFTYPAGIESGGGGAPNPYVRRLVLLEFGARSDHWPTEEHPVQPYAAETMPTSSRSPSAASGRSVRSGPSGRRRRCSMPKLISRSTSLRATGSLVTTTTLPGSTRAPSDPRPSRTASCSRRSSLT
ncbi:MAG: nucleotidyl transferase AbiEii/AbiGii toxin family protein, partial [Singulisphaera sp.]